MKKRKFYFIAARCTQLFAILMALFMLLAPESSMHMVLLARYTNRIVFGGKLMAIIPIAFLLTAQWRIMAQRNNVRTITRDDWEILGLLVILMLFFVIEQVGF